MARKRMSKSRSRKLFKSTANKMHVRNGIRHVPRGGIAL